VHNQYCYVDTNRAKQAIQIHNQPRIQTSPVPIERNSTKETKINENQPSRIASKLTKYPLSWNAFYFGVPTISL